MKNNKTFFYFLIYITFLHVAYFFYAIFHADIFTQDSIGYLAQAENIVKHKSLYAAPWSEKLKPDWLTFRPPLYAIFILCCKWIYNSNYTVLIFQSLLSILTLVSTYRFVITYCQIPEKCVVGFLGVVLLLYPSQLIHCNMIMSDILFQFVMLQAFIFSYKLFVEPNYKHAAMASLLFMMGMLLKPVSFMLGFTVLFLLLLLWFKTKHIRFLIPFVILPLTYHAYCSYNQKVTGYYHYTTVTPYFVLKYMAKYTNAQLYGEAYADSVQAAIMQQADAQADFGLRYELMNREGKKIILQYWPMFVWFNIKGWIMIMIDPGRFEWYKFLNIKQQHFDGLYHLINTKGFVNGISAFLKIAPLGLLVILTICLAFNISLFALFMYYLLFIKGNLPLKILIFVFVGYLVGATGVLGLARYRLAFAPLLWMAGIQSLHYLLHRNKNV